MAAGDGAQLPATVAASSRSVDKALDEAAASGALNLSNRKLKEFPRSAKNYDLSDITHADLSKNRLCELPEELCHFISLENLSLYHNGMRSLSSSLGNLQALTYLNLSRNLLCSLPSSVFQLPLLRVLIVSNNKLSSLPTFIYSLTHLRQLDVSCNELESLPAELGQLDCLRDLNLRRNHLTALPEEISELPLVRLDVSCNRISHVPLCYRHLLHLQSISLDNNPLQMPPANICSKGKYHIFKYLHMEACRRTQEDLDKHLRPTGFNSCLSDQELFGGLDSGFNSVDSGSKRWSGNESADDFSERSLRLAELSRDHKRQEEDGSAPVEAPKVNGEAEQVDLVDSSVTEEEEEHILSKPPQVLKEGAPQDSPTCRSGRPTEAVSPSSPSLEERRRPGTLSLWQERERIQQQRDKTRGASPKKSSSPSANSTDHVTWAPPTALLQRSEAPSSPKTSPPPLGQAHKPNSFLFRMSSRSHCRTTGSVSGVGESAVRSPKEEREDIKQLRQTLESRLKLTLSHDLGAALSDGTVLCQLANQLRPRSVLNIHVPSPAVPKLSPAKCRVNVNNFIAACCKMGVAEADVCACSDVLLCRLPAVRRCVTALLSTACGKGSHAPCSSSSAPSLLLSTDFLFFYSAAMALLYVLYCYLLS
ncbi:leucine-rich repeat and calponin homology domain-containing protein 4 isoform X2 [Gouania willdenowi]|uniref:leucine-rich repeat and calponin homology domain-containing protein 4 isoform X2 n=1 Tax=Gouania willdenowi TaxID=441366 RepID=UPI001054BEE5|nr:leucine-rich repeat and calponin homology domain-containing protein 4 isoform X2 [Gouania willdenowi]